MNWFSPSGAPRQKLRSSKNKRQPKSGNADDTVKHPQEHQPLHIPRVLGFVLGSGSFTKTGVFSMSTSNQKPSSRNSLNSSNHTACTTPPSSPTTPRQQFLRHSSSFLRVADLNLHHDKDDDHVDHQHNDDASSITWSDSGDSALSSVYANATTTRNHQSGVANFSYAAVNPPPGVDHDPQERWIALDDGAGSHAPIAPRAVAALAKIGLEAAMDEDMWTPHTAARHFKAAPWHTATWASPSSSQDGSTSSPISHAELPPAHSKEEEMVLLWTGKFQHGLYGSELPAVRAAGIIPAPPKDLFDLLIDSDRVKEYNQLSLGRQDLLVLQDNTTNNNNNNNLGGDQEGPFGTSVVTKVMRSSSKPPLVSKTMELVSMLHAQELDDGSGYLIVTRAVTHPEDRDKESSVSVLRSEILLGVNIIRRVDGDPNRCIMINMIHMRSPMVPMIIANRIGATAAANFIKDLRSTFR